MDEKTKALVDQVRLDNFVLSDGRAKSAMDAADLIEAQAREIELLRVALQGMVKWFGRYPEFVPAWPYQAESVRRAIDAAIDAAKE